MFLKNKFRFFLKFENYKCMFELNEKFPLPPKYKVKLYIFSYTIFACTMYT